MGVNARGGLRAGAGGGEARAAGVLPLAGGDQTDRGRPRARGRRPTSGRAARAALLRLLESEEAGAETESGLLVLQFSNDNAERLYASLGMNEGNGRTSGRQGS